MHRSISPPSGFPPRWVTNEFCSCHVRWPATYPCSSLCVGCVNDEGHFSALDVTLIYFTSLPWWGLIHHNIHKELERKSESEREWERVVVVVVDWESEKKKGEILLLTNALLQSWVLVWWIKNEWLGTKRPCDYVIVLLRAVICSQWQRGGLMRHLV